MIDFLNKFLNKERLSPDGRGSSSVNPESKDLKNRDKEFLSDFFNLCRLYQSLRGWKKDDFAKLETDLNREWRDKKQTDRRFQPNAELQTALAEIEQEYNQVFSRLEELVNQCFNSRSLQSIFKRELGQEIHSLEQAEKHIQTLVEPFYLDFKDKNPFGKHINDFPTEYSSEKNLKEYQAVLQEITDSPDWQAIVKKLTVLPGSHHEALEQYQQEQEPEAKNKALRRLLALGRPEEVEQEDFPIDLNKLEINFDERELAGLKDNLTQAKPAIEQFQIKWPKVWGKMEVKRTTEAIDTITATIREGKDKGKEISFDIAKELKHWSDFYQQNGVDWVTLPETISLTSDQAKEMTRLMEMGFDNLIIIPDNLVGEPEIKGDKISKPADHYDELHKKMSEGYSDTRYGDSYKGDGGIGASKDKTTKLRIILTKDTQDLKDDELFNQTLGKSVDDLTKPKDGLFAKTNTHGLSESEYLVFKRDYFNKNGKHLDENGWTLLTESDRPLSGHVPSAGCHPDGERLFFYSDARDFHLPGLGCRLAGSFEIEI